MDIKIYQPTKLIARETS